MAWRNQWRNGAQCRRGVMAYRQYENSSNVNENQAMKIISINKWLIMQSAENLESNVGGEILKGYGNSNNGGESANG